MNRPIRTLAAIAACGLAISACTTFRPRSEPGPVVAAAAPRLPPAVSAPPAAVVRAPAPAREACVPRGLPRAPKYPDSDAALRDAGGAADRYQLMAAGRLLRERRLADLERVVDGCR